MQEWIRASAGDDEVFYNPYKTIEFLEMREHYRESRYNTRLILQQ